MCYRLYKYHKVTPQVLQGEKRRTFRQENELLKINYPKDTMQKIYF